MYEEANISIRRRKIVNTVLFFVMIGVNALASIFPIGGKTIAMVSEAYPNLFTPAPLTFSIWFFIYVMMGIFILMQWGVFVGKEAGDKIENEVGNWFVVSSLFNIAWVFAWINSTILSLLLIVGLLYSLFRALENVTTMWVRAGFGLYFGWIAVATLANLSVFLTSIGIYRINFVGEMLTLAMLVAATAVAIYLVTRKDLIFSAVAIAWAMFGIVVRHIFMYEFAGRYISVVAFALIGIIAIITSIALRIITKNDVYERTIYERRDVR